MLNNTDNNSEDPSKKTKKKPVRPKKLIELTDEEKQLSLKESDSFLPTEIDGRGEPQKRIYKKNIRFDENSVAPDSIAKIVVTKKQFKIDKNNVPLRLNPRQKRFCEAYVINYDAKESAKIAGYNGTSENSFAVQGYNNLKNKACRLYIAELQEAENSLADIRLSKENHIISLLALKAELNKDVKKNVNQLLKLEELLIKLSGNMGQNTNKQQLEYDLSEAFGFKNDEDSDDDSDSDTDDETTSDE